MVQSLKEASMMYLMYQRMEACLSKQTVVQRVMIKLVGTC